MEDVAAILNSGLVLLLAGAIVGAVGLFTWQRRDWLFKQQYLRTQTMLDRRLKLIEKINADVGRLLATSAAVAVVTKKKAAAVQRDEAIKAYNDEQVGWFTSYSSHESLLAFFFSSSLSESFIAKIVGAYKQVDIQLSDYQQNPDNKHYTDAYNALQNLRTELRSWNSMALDNLSSDPEGKTNRETCGNGT